MTPRTRAHQALLSSTISWSLLKFTSIESRMLSKHLILLHLSPLLLLPSIFPSSGSFPISRLFASSGQNIGASASASVLPMNTQGRFPLRLMALISLQSKGLSRVFSSITMKLRGKCNGHYSHCALSCSVVSASWRPHGLQLARLLCPWDFPGKNSGVGCHLLLQFSF